MLLELAPEQVYAAWAAKPAPGSAIHGSIVLSLPPHIEKVRPVDLQVLLEQMHLLSCAVIGKTASLRSRMFAVLVLIELASLLGNYY